MGDPRADEEDAATTTQNWCYQLLLLNGMPFELIRTIGLKAMAAEDSWGIRELLLVRLLEDYCAAEGFADRIPGLVGGLGIVATASAQADEDAGVEERRKAGGKGRRGKKQAPGAEQAGEAGKKAYPFGLKPPRLTRMLGEMPSGELLSSCLSCVAVEKLRKLQRPEGMVKVVDGIWGAVQGEWEHFMRTFKPGKEGKKMVQQVEQAWVKAQERRQDLIALMEKHFGEDRPRKVGPATPPRTRSSGSQEEKQKHQKEEEKTMAKFLRELRSFPPAEDVKQQLKEYCQKLKDAHGTPFLRAVEDAIKSKDYPELRPLNITASLRLLKPGGPLAGAEPSAEQQPQEKPKRRPKSGRLPSWVRTFQDKPASGGAQGPGTGSKVGRDQVKQPKSAGGAGKGQAETKGKEGAGKGQAETKEKEDAGKKRKGKGREEDTGGATEVEPPVVPSASPAKRTQLQSSKAPAQTLQELTEQMKRCFPSGPPPVGASPVVQSSPGRPASKKPRAQARQEGLVEAEVEEEEEEGDRAPPTVASAFGQRAGKLLKYYTVISAGSDGVQRGRQAGQGLGMPPSPPRRSSRLTTGPQPPSPEGEQKRRRNEAIILERMVEDGQEILESLKKGRGARGNVGRGGRRGRYAGAHGDEDAEEEAGGRRQGERRGGQEGALGGDSRPDLATLTEFLRIACARLRALGVDPKYEALSVADQVVAKVRQRRAAEAQEAAARGEEASAGKKGQGGKGRGRGGRKGANDAVGRAERARRNKAAFDDVDNEVLEVEDEDEIEEVNAEEEEEEAMREEEWGAGGSGGAGGDGDKDGSTESGKKRKRSLGEEMDAAAGKEKGGGTTGRVKGGAEPSFQSRKPSARILEWDSQEDDLGGPSVRLPTPGGPRKLAPISPEKLAAVHRAFGRRKVQRWTEQETDALIEAVKQHGPSWSAILREHASDFSSGRTQVDLKDRWRNLQKKGAV